jgi:mRNA interferase RelE/StbE
MIYSLATTAKFDKQVKRLDKTNQRQITDYLLKNVNGSDDPRAFGKALTGNLKGLWRYRIGDYRVICNIQDQKCIVLALETAHRKNIYR